MKEKLKVEQLPENIQMESVPCPNGCESNDISVLTGHDRLHGFSGEFTVVRCQQCGLERTNPRPTADTIGYYYPDNYGPYISSSKPNYSGPKGGISKLIFQLLSLKTRKLPPIKPGRMLEIGCSSGDFMMYAKSLGWVVEGIEFSATAVETARERGFMVHAGAVELASDPAENYELIVGWMVLEHLHQPSSVLMKLRTWISGNGYLVLSVPDSKSLSRRLFGNRNYDLHLPNHLFHFNDKTIKNILEKNGWKVEKIFWQRNCNTLLWSFQYWAEETKKPRLLKIAKWLRVENGAIYIRLLLSVLLGITRQSGRLEVWARPV